MEINGFGLENFKIFKEYTWFDFAPITLLTGPNNSGKSSLIRGIMLLINNIKNGTIGNFTIQDNYGIVGDYYSVANCDKKESSIKIRLNDIEFELSTIPNYPEKLRCSSISFFEGEQIISTMIDEVGGQVFSYYLDFKNLINYIKSSINDIPVSKHDKKELIEFIRVLQRNKVNINEWGVTLLGQTHQGSSINNPLNNFIANFEDKISKSLDEQNDQLILNPQNPGFNSKWYDQELGPYRIQLDKKIIYYYFDLIGKIGINHAFEKVEFLNSLPGNHAYLPINKGFAKRIYGLDGDSIIEKFLNEMYYGLGYHDSNEKSGRFPEEAHSFLEKWIREFKIGKEIKIKYIQDAGYIIQIKIFKNKWIHLKDLGYGITNLFVQLLAICKENVGPLIRIFEEPESNLHPAFQSKLADVYLDAIEEKGARSTHFIIETHSEYIIRKFQYLVAQKKMKPEDIIIYYFQDASTLIEGQEHIKQIRINADGRLSEPFGPGFFDESDRLMSGILTGELN